MQTQAIITLDRLLSTYIVIYSYVYIFGLAPYNPIMLLYIAYGFALLSSIMIALRGKSILILIIFFSINTVFKVIPMILVWNDKLTSEDILFSCIFILTYVVYMHIIKDDIICVYRDLVWYYIDRGKGRETVMHKFITDLSLT